MSGFQHAEDAAVYKLDEEKAAIVTVDVITPLVDDPYAFGAIAAANSLSDVYAMGGTGLISLGFLSTPSGFPMDVAAEILRGGAELAMKCGAPVVGGHSVEGKDLMYGLCVVGLAHPDQVCSNAALEPGDQLLLTKPLGTGTLTTALKNETLTLDEVQPAIDGMQLTNAAAVEPLRAARVRACTDITGFGLLGHLAEMAKASDVQGVINMTSVPEYPGARRMLAEGCVTRGNKRNIEYIRDLGPVKGEPEALLLDPQTSGGLLIAVRPERLDWLEKALSAAGYEAVARVGEIREGSGVCVE